MDEKKLLRRIACLEIRASKLEDMFQELVNAQGLFANQAKHVVDSQPFCPTCNVGMYEGFVCQMPDGCPNGYDAS